MYCIVLSFAKNSTPAGRTIARECMRVAVQKPGQVSIVAAIQRGWLSGLTVEELESCILSYLRAAASLCDLEVMDQAIDECRSLFPEERLQEAVAARRSIEDLQENLRSSIRSRDITALCDAIVRCEAYGWPSKPLEEAYVAKCQLQQLIARLRYASGSADVDLLSKIVGECESLGLPERDLVAARQRQEQLEALLQRLQASVEERNLGELNAAINAAQAPVILSGSPK